MPLVDLDDPEELRARWSALAAVAHATGFDRRWYADAGGFYHQDETGSDLRLVRLDGGRSVLFGFHTQHSRTAGTDLLAGAPDWIGQPEVKRRIATGELGFVYGSFNGTWARASYEGDPWQPVDDGFAPIASWITSDEEAARELVEWAAEWADYLGGLDELLPVGIGLIRAAGASSLSYELLQDFFERLGIGPRSAQQPDLRAALTAAAAFDLTGGEGEGGGAASVAFSEPLPEPAEPEEEELFIVPPGVSPFTGQPIGSDAHVVIGSDQPDPAPQYDRSDPPYNPDVRYDAPGNNSPFPADPQYTAEPQYDTPPIPYAPTPQYEAPADSQYDAPADSPFRPGAQPPVEPPPARKDDNYGIVSKKPRLFGRKRKQRDEDNASLAGLGLVAPDPEPPQQSDPGPLLAAYAGEPTPAQVDPYDLPSSEPPRVGAPGSEGEDFYASLFADAPAAATYTPDTPASLRRAHDGDPPAPDSPADAWPDNDATSELEAVAGDVTPYAPADPSDETGVLEPLPTDTAPAAPLSATPDDDTGVIPTLDATAYAGPFPSDAGSFSSDAGSISSEADAEDSGPASPSDASQSVRYEVDQADEDSARPSALGRSPFVQFNQPGATPASPASDTAPPFVDPDATEPFTPYDPSAADSTSPQDATGDSPFAQYEVDQNEDSGTAPPSAQPTAGDNSPFVQFNQPGGRPAATSAPPEHDSDLASPFIDPDATEPFTPYDPPAADSTSPAPQDASDGSSIARSGTDSGSPSPQHDGTSPFAQRDNTDADPDGFSPFPQYQQPGATPPSPGNQAHRGPSALDRHDQLDEELDATSPSARRDATPPAPYGQSEDDPDTAAQYEQGGDKPNAAEASAQYEPTDDAPDASSPFARYDRTENEPDATSQVARPGDLDAISPLTPYGETGADVDRQAGSVSDDGAVDAPGAARYDQPAAAHHEARSAASMPAVVHPDEDTDLISPDDNTGVLTPVDGTGRTSRHHEPGALSPDERTGVLSPLPGESTTPPADDSRARSALADATSPGNYGSAPTAEGSLSGDNSSVGDRSAASARDDTRPLSALDDRDLTPSATRRDGSSAGTASDADGFSAEASAEPRQSPLEREWIGGAWINGEWIEDAAAYLAANPHLTPHPPRPVRRRGRNVRTESPADSRGDSPLDGRGGSPLDGRADPAPDGRAGAEFSEGESAADGEPRDGALSGAGQPIEESASAGERRAFAPDATAAVERSKNDGTFGDEQHEAERAGQVALGGSDALTRRTHPDESAAEPESQSASEPDAGADTGIQLRTVREAGAEPESAAGRESELDADAGTEPQLRSEQATGDADPQAGSRSEAEPDAENGAEPQLRSEHATGNADAEAGSESESEFDVQAGPQAESRSAHEADAQVEPAVELEGHSESGSEFALSADAQGGTGTQFPSEGEDSTEPESEAGPEVGTKPEPNLESNAESRSGADPEPQAGAERAAESEAGAAREAQARLVADEQSEGAESPEFSDGGSTEVEAGGSGEDREPVDGAQAEPDVVELADGFDGLADEAPTAEIPAISGDEQDAGYDARTEGSSTNAGGPRVYPPLSDRYGGEPSDGLGEGDEFEFGAEVFRDEMLGDADWTADQLGQGSWPSDEAQAEGTVDDGGSRAADGEGSVEGLAEAERAADGEGEAEVDTQPVAPHAEAAESAVADEAGSETVQAASNGAAANRTAANGAVQPGLAVNGVTPHAPAANGVTPHVPANAAAMTIPDLTGHEFVESLPPAVEQAMRAEPERPRPRPQESAAVKALRDWCRVRTKVVPSGFTIQVQVLDPANPSFRFDLEPPEVDDPEHPAERLSELLGDLWLTEAESEQGGWLFARIDAAGRTLRIDRWYDQVPEWWDAPIPVQLDVEGLVRRLYRRGPDWQPSYLEQLYTSAR